MDSSLSAAKDCLLQFFIVHSSQSTVHSPLTTMKKYISLILLFGVCIFAQMPEVTKASRSYHKHSKEYDKGQYYELKRQTQSYLL